MVLVDRAGRRPLLLGGVAAMAAALAGLATQKAAGLPPTVAAAALLLYVGAYQVGNTAPTAGAGDQVMPENACAATTAPSPVSAHEACPVSARRSALDPSAGAHSSMRLC